MVLRARWGSGSNLRRGSRPLATKGLRAQKYPLGGSEGSRARTVWGFPSLPCGLMLSNLQSQCVPGHRGPRLLLTQQKLLVREQQSESPHLRQQATPAWTLPPSSPGHPRASPEAYMPPACQVSYSICFLPLSFSILLDEEGHIKITGL